MSTVFSHIIQKRFSQVNEDVASDALTYILNSSESARNGMMKLLRSIESDIPELRFQAQQTEENIRPDICGFDQNEPRVYIESKFWAGLTENQPISYLKKLSEYKQPTILLVIGPEAREQTLQRELIHRLAEGGISISKTDDLEKYKATYFKTDTGPTLAITTWKKLLSILELEVSDDPVTTNDIVQLRSLCESADLDAFLPLSSFEKTDQRIPALILQLGSIIQTSIDLAVSKKVVNIKGFMPKSSWNQIGRYGSFLNKKGIGFWFGIHFDYWKKYGGTPLWLTFPTSNWGRAFEVKSLLDPWASKNGVFTILENNEFAVAIDMLTGEEKDQVIRDIVNTFNEISNVIAPLMRNS